MKCKWCGDQTPYLETQECDSCWELRHRIELQPILAAEIFRSVVGIDPNTGGIDALSKHRV